MSAGKIALIALGVVFFILGYIGLFPENAGLLFARLNHLYAAGFSADPKGWHVLGAIGGASAVAGIWALSSAFRRAH